MWIDGSNQGYFHWNDGEPNGDTEQCVEMYMHNRSVYIWISGRVVGGRGGQGGSGSNSEVDL